VKVADRPTLADVLQGRAEKPPASWGGLKSYLPEQPEAMKSAQKAVGGFLASLPPEAMLALNFLSRRPTALPSRWEKTYHGTAEPDFQLQSKPIWSGKQDIAEFFGINNGGPGEPGAIAPLLVDTADYVTVRPRSVMEKIDDKVGSGRELYRGGTNWLAAVLQMLGKRGLRYEGLRRDFDQPVTLSLDPATVRSAHDPAGQVPHAKPRPPSYLMESD